MINGNSTQFGPIVHSWKHQNMKSNVMTKTDRKHGRQTQHDACWRDNSTQFH